MRPGALQRHFLMQYSRQYRQLHTVPAFRVKWLSLADQLVNLVHWGSIQWKASEHCNIKFLYFCVKWIWITFSHKKFTTICHEYARRKSGAVQYAKHCPEGQRQCAAHTVHYCQKAFSLFEPGQRNMLMLNTLCSLGESNVSWGQPANLSIK